MTGLEGEEKCFLLLKPKTGKCVDLMMLRWTVQEVKLFFERVLSICAKTKELPRKVAIKTDDEQYFRTCVFQKTPLQADLCEF